MSRAPISMDAPTQPPTQVDDKLVKWRALDSIQVLGILADHVKVDSTFKPMKATLTRRVHVNAAGFDWEFLVVGPKFYNMRTRTGGGGAIDLVMHIWQVPFKKAVNILRQAGI